MYKLLIAAVVGLGLGQGGDPILITDKTGLEWDAPEKNVDGSPYDDHSHYTLALADAVADLNGTGQPAVTARVDCMDETCQAAIATLYEALGDGTYRAWVQAEDSAGNQSEWAVAPESMRVNKSVPGVVINLHIVADITGTITP